MQHTLGTGRSFEELVCSVVRLHNISVCMKHQPRSQAVFCRIIARGCSVVAALVDSVDVRGVGSIERVPLPPSEALECTKCKCGFL